MPMETSCVVRGWQANGVDGCALSTGFLDGVDGRGSRRAPAVAAASQGPCFKSRRGLLVYSEVRCGGICQLFVVSALLSVPHPFPA